MLATLLTALELDSRAIKNLITLYESDYSDCSAEEFAAIVDEFLSRHDEDPILTIQVTFNTSDLFGEDSSFHFDYEGGED